MKMKNYFIIAMCCLSSALFAQETTSESEFLAKENESEVTKNNLVKFNVVPLVWGTGSLTYERKIGKRFAAGATINYRPNSHAPFKNELETLINDGDNSSFDINKLKYSNFSIAPEVKFYLGKKGAFHGFYVAAFAKWENTKINYAYRFEELSIINKDPELPLSGTIKGFTGGLYFGAEWHLGKNIYLDWQIIGGNFGAANIDVMAHKELTLEEQKELRDFAEDLKDSFSDIDYEINGQGVKLKGKMPWAGLRTGLSIGYRF